MFILPSEWPVASKIPSGWNCKVASCALFALVIVLPDYRSSRDQASARPRATCSPSGWKLKSLAMMFSEKMARESAKL